MTIVLGEVFKDSECMPIEGYIDNWFKFYTEDYMKSYRDKEQPQNPQDQQQLSWDVSYVKLLKENDEMEKAADFMAVKILHDNIEEIEGLNSKPITVPGYYELDRQKNNQMRLRLGKLVVAKSFNHEGEGQIPIVDWDNPKKYARYYDSGDQRESLGNIVCYDSQQDLALTKVSCGYLFCDKGAISDLIYHFERAE